MKKLAIIFLCIVAVSIWGATSKSEEIRLSLCIGKEMQRLGYKDINDIKNQKQDEKVIADIISGPCEDKYELYLKAFLADQRKQRNKNLSKEELAKLDKAIEKTERDWRNPSYAAKKVVEEIIGRNK